MSYVARRPMNSWKHLYSSLLKEEKCPIHALLHRQSPKHTSSIFRPSSGRVSVVSGHHNKHHVILPSRRIFQIERGGLQSTTTTSTFHLINNQGPLSLYPHLPQPSFYQSICLLLPALASLRGESSSYLFHHSSDLRLPLLPSSFLPSHR